MMDVLKRHPQIMGVLDYFDLTTDAEIAQYLLNYSNYGSIP